MKTVRYALRVLAAVIALATVLVSASAQTIRPLQIEDAVSARGFHIQGQIAVIAPDGELVAYTVCDPRRIVVTPGGDANKATKNAAYSSMGCDIWVSPLAGGEARNITPKVGNNWGPAWSPDGASLAFYSDRSGAPRLWVWERRSGQSRMVADVATRTRFGFELPIWTPDGRSLIAKLFPEGMTQEELDGGSQKSTNANDAVAGSTVVVLRSVPKPKETPEKGKKDDDLTPPPNDRLADIAVIGVWNGEVRRIARKVRTVTVRLSPDGRLLAFLDNNRSRPSGAAYSEDALVVVDVGSGERRELVASVRQEFSGAMSWSPDSRWIAYTSANPAPPKSDGAITNPSGATRAADLYVVSPDGGSARRFTGAPEGTFSTDFLPPLWDDRGKHLYAVGAKKLWRADAGTGVAAPIEVPGDFEVRRLLGAGDGRRLWSPDGGSSAYILTSNGRTRQQGFYRVELGTGRATRLIEDDKEFDSLFSQPVVAANGQRVVYLSASAYESPDLWIAASDFVGARRLTAINPQLESYMFGRSRLIDFRSVDGELLRATVLMPAGYEPGKRYPLVVWVYASGMGSQAPNRFGLVGYSAYNMHMLTTRGYAVMWPDIPVRAGSPMLDLMKAVMPALDRAIELGIADAERLAVMGQSNGGYSTLSLLVQTNRFKVAVMNSGFGNLIAFYGSMTDDGSGRWIPWLEHRGGAMGAPPWEAPQRYLQNSPVFYLDRVQTPLIIQAGASDQGIVPYSDEVFVDLKRLGKDVTYLRYGGEGHVLASYENLIDYWNRVIAFYNQHLGPLSRTDKVSSRAK